MRWRRDDIIWAALLLVMGLLPLRWYLGLADARDERFAWRMFTAADTVSCQVRVSVGGHQLDLDRRYGRSWVRLLQRGHNGALERARDELCTSFPDAERALVRRCRTGDGPTERLTLDPKRFCSAPLVARREVR